MENEFKQAIGNQEIEGIEKPTADDFKKIIELYKDKLGSNANDSLLYSLNEGIKIIEDDNNGKSKIK